MYMYEYFIIIIIIIIFWILMYACSSVLMGRCDICVILYYIVLSLIDNIVPTPVDLYLLLRIYVAVSVHCEVVS